MHNDYSGRDRKLMNGVAMLGGRSASATEVDLVLGVPAAPVQGGRVRGWLKRLLGRQPAVVAATRLSTSG